MNNKQLTLFSLIISFLFALSVYNFIEIPIFLFIYGLFLPIIDNKTKYFFEAYLICHSVYTVIVIFTKYQSFLIETFTISEYFIGWNGTFLFFIAYYMVRLRIGLALWTYSLKKVGLYKRMKDLKLFL